jgi:hypothetical protein
MAYRLRIINEAAIRDHKHYFSKKELVELLQKVGFKKISHSYFELGFNQKVTAHK